MYKGKILLIFVITFLFLGTEVNSEIDEAIQIKICELNSCQFFDVFPSEQIEGRRNITLEQQNYLNSIDDKCFNIKTLGNRCSINESDDDGYLTGGDSMLPLIPIGTKLIEKIYVGEELHTCEIIRFDSKEIYPTFPYTLHRIIGFDGDKIIVKGDNNNIYEIINRDKITHRLCGVEYE